MAITDDLELLYNTEKFLIEGHWEDERRLNMIPGGQAGLRYLRENSILCKDAIVTPDGRDHVIGEWLNKVGHNSLPSLSLAFRWQDDAWAAAQICSRSDRLSVSQITAIRELATTHTPLDIATRTGATHAQIQGVISGKKYSRVK